MTAPALDFFDLHVLRSARISPSFVRVTLGGEDLARLTCGGRDQRFKLFLPRHPGEREVAVPREEGAANWWPAWQRMDPERRAVMRTFTVLEHRRDPGEFDIDFALHGDGGADGPASRWARTARPGDPVTILGPTEEDNVGVDFRPPADTAWVLVTADATALPAAAGILAWLPPGTPARVWIEVPYAADRRELPTKADAEVTWLHREEPSDAAPASLLDAVRSASLPDGAPYAWLAGEAGSVTAVRRHLVRERGIDRKRVTFTGYWRRGTSEDDLIEAAIAAEGGDTGEAAPEA
ncbi:siderophore-interacting protein [Streptomyces sp. 4N509B]|uniref:siderophore-interacting protein n=1 Tax=Streptomyces sp. 4N509B TaxID=3457413 RepID=UPI003FD4D8E0